MRIAIITGSTRPGRNNIAVARWVYELAAKRRDATFELVDIADYHLPWAGALKILRSDSHVEAA